MLLILWAPLGRCSDRLWQVLAGDVVFEVEVADTVEKRRQGLMGREKLAASRGLLMVLPTEQIAGIWMKRTQFSLDVVWLSSSGEVVDKKTLQPCRQLECPVFRPKQAARYVLEVNAGVFPLNTGQMVEILRPSGDSHSPPDLRTTGGMRIPPEDYF